MPDALPAVAARIVNEALALRASHPHAPAVDILDLVIRVRGLWLVDLIQHMVPPAPFAALVAEAMGDAWLPADWRAPSGSSAQPAVRDFMRRSYAGTVVPKFVRRYGYSLLRDDRESAQPACSFRSLLR